MINIRNISLFGGLFAIVVIALGAWTRLVDAGLGCPDWPGCYGFVTFPITDSEIALAESRYPTFPYEIDKAIPEVVHRYFAAMLGLIAIFLVFFAIRYKVDRSLRNLSIFLLFFICCQGLFGYLTVSLKLLPIIVTGHLFGGFITLSLFFFIFLKAADFRFLNYIDIKKYRYNLSGEPVDEPTLTDARAVKDGYISISILDYDLDQEPLRENLKSFFNE